MNAPGIVSPLRAGAGQRRPGARGGYVWFVGAGPGGADLITLRGWRALQEADEVLYDSLVDPELLEGLDARVTYVGKRCGNHSMTQEEICDRLVELGLRGRRVVRLKGGDPTVLGRVGEEALRVADASIPFEIVPGVTSAIGVPALAGIPLTHRPIADSFVVATVHRRSDALDFSIPPYQTRTTLVLLMAAATVESWRSQLLDRGYPPTLPLAFVSAGGTPHERVVTTCVEAAARDLRAAALATPILAVAGHVVALRERLGAGQNVPAADGATELALAGR